MSCTQNGFAISEGHRSFAMMPAIIQCDNRHARQDTRPLTREQIAKIKGVSYPIPRIKPLHAPERDRKTERTRTTPEERREMVALYRAGAGVVGIAYKFHRSRSSVRDILIHARVAITRAKYSQKKEAA